MFTTHSGSFGWAEIAKVLSLRAIAVAKRGSNRSSTRESIEVLSMANTREGTRLAVETESLALHAARRPSAANSRARKCVATIETVEVKIKFGGEADRSASAPARNATAVWSL